MTAFKHLLLAASFLSFAAEASAANLYVGFNEPLDSDIGIYPLAPNVFGTEFAPATNPQDLTIAGGKLYWIDGDSVLDANLDGTGLSTLQTFGIAPTSIEVDAASGHLYVGFNTPLDSDIGIYPLVPNVFGTFFANATNPQDLTIAGGKLYWIDGNSIFDANLDGTGLSTLQTFGIAPSSIEVYDPPLPPPPPPAAPEPGTLALFSIAAAALLATKRRVSPR